MNLFKTLLSRRTLAVVIFLVASFFLLFVFYFIKLNFSKPIPFITNVASFSNEEKEINFGLPVRLKIPVINIDSVVEHVGLAPDGTMDIPKNPDDVAWFQLGQRPGENGSAVIAGHYGWKDNKISAFDNLHKLSKGDKLYIEDENGIIISFVVRESKNYDYKTDAPDVFSSYDDKAHLNLVTCEGVWNEIFKNYSGRLVVFTDREF